MVAYVHMGYGSSYSRYRVISVHKGEVTRQLDLDDKQFMALRRDRFKAFQKTKVYQDQIAQTRKQLGEGAEDFMFSFYSEQYLSDEPDAGAP